MGFVEKLEDLEEVEYCVGKGICCAVLENVVVVWVVCGRRWMIWRK